MSPSPGAARPGLEPSAAGPVSTPAGPPPSAPASAEPTATTAPPSVGPTPIVVAKTSPEAGLKTVWEKAGPSLTRDWTWQPAVDPAGRIWAASSFDNVFWIFDKDGKYLESWGTPGAGEGELSLTADHNGHGAVAFGPDGGFYVADAGHSRILQFDKSRKFVRSWGSFGTDAGQFTIPISIATDRTGNIYVIDDGRHDVQEFAPDGTFIRTAATNIGPYFAVEANGDVLAVDNTDVVLYRFGPDGERTMAVDLSQVISFATGMAVTPSGNIVIASSTGGSANFEYENLIELEFEGDPAPPLANRRGGHRVECQGGPAVHDVQRQDPRGPRLFVPGEVAEQAMTEAGGWVDRAGASSSARDTDARLLERAAEGDVDAFDVLLRPRLDRLFRMAVAITRSEADARDAVQEASVHAWRELPRLRDRERFDAWLAQILVNACRSLLRRRRRTSVREIDVDAIAGPAAETASG